jgi:PilZ domain-containing protein
MGQYQSGRALNQAVCFRLSSFRPAERLIYLTFPANVAGQMLKQNAMEERRKHARSDIDEPAYLSAGGSVMSCTVRNISGQGAAIDVENPAFVPGRFRLVMRDHTVYECQVIWIQQNRIGVSFVAAPQQTPAIKR